MKVQPRLSLSWRLALSIAAIVITVMVVVSLPQRLTHRQQMDERRTAWLRALARPIGVTLRTPGVARDLEAEIAEFRAAVGSIAGREPSVGVVTESGVELYGVAEELATGTFAIAETDPGAPSPLQVVVSSREFQGLESLSGYWWHVVATIVALSVSLYLVLLYLVARPLDRLLDGVRLMEMGYWGEVPEPSGAWEIRWLSHRFHEMSLRLERTVQNLAAAERRGGRASKGANSPVGVSSTLVRPSTDDSCVDDVEAVRATILARLEALEALKADGPAARTLAEEVLDQDPALADRIGAIDIKTRAEDLAFSVLDQDGFVALGREIAALAPDLLRRADAVEHQLTRALEAAGVSVLHVQRRIKGLGSVWRKMRHKNLTLSQVHDLLALRVVVASTDECYRALHAIHSEFEPVVGRFKDYIADPKPNGYESVHTSVRLRSGMVCEMQIRSLRMHQVVESGDSAHWRYRLAGALP